MVLKFITEKIITALLSLDINGCVDPILAVFAFQPLLQAQIITKQSLI